MNPENDRFRDFLGVTAWHKAGYTGKRVLVASGEDFERYPSTHAGETYRVFREFCPDAEVIYLPVVHGTFGAIIKSEFIDYSIPEIIRRGVHVVWASLSPSVDGKFLDEPMKQIPYCTVLMSAGNDMGDAYNKFLTCEAIYGVGAYLLMADSSSPAPAHYTSITECVDFAGPAMVHVPSANGNFSYQFGGTSCAAPVLAAMCSLINDFFIDKTGRPLSSEMMYQFLKDNSRDIGVKGKDTKTGWGAPILPPPETVDIRRYTGEMTQEQFEAMYDKINPTYATLDDVPDYWKDETKALIDSGKLKGTGEGKLNIRHETLRAVIIGGR